jgi:hypothetical protein
VGTPKAIALVATACGRLWSPANWPGYPTARCPETVIRVLATILASLLLAIGLGIAGYSYVLTLRRGPLHSVERHAPMAPAASVQPPRRLPPDPEAHRRAMPASVAVNQEERVPVRIALQNLPEFLTEGPAGIALFSAETGADFDWIPLSTCRDGVNVETTSPVVGPLTITIARDRAHARHGYLAQTTHTFAARRGASEVRQFDVSAYPVELQVTADRNAGPLRLTRVKDPGWQASDAAPTGVSCRPGHSTTLVLGPGDYELTDPLDPTRKQPFTVPTSGPVLISEALSRPAADHP